MLPLKFADAVVHYLEAHRVGEPHRPTAIRRKTIAVEVDDVYINRSKSVAFRENARSFVDQGINATVNDFARRYLTLRDACLARPLADERGNLRVGSRAAVLVVFVPSRAGLLAVASHLAQPIACHCLANARLL